MMLYTYKDGPVHRPGWYWLKMKKLSDERIIYIDTHNIKDYDIKLYEFAGPIPSPVKI